MHHICDDGKENMGHAENLLTHMNPEGTQAGFIKASYLENGEIP